MDGFIDPSKLNRGHQQAERLIQLCKFAMTRSGMTVFLIDTGRTCYAIAAYGLCSPGSPQQGHATIPWAFPFFRRLFREPIHDNGLRGFAKFVVIKKPATKARKGVNQQCSRRSRLGRSSGLTP
jgi:hypothetical protein